VTCQKAAVVANKMQEIFKDKMELRIFKTDSPEAIPYNLRSSTNVFINEELVSIDVATSETEMKKYITSVI